MVNRHVGKYVVNFMLIGLVFDLDKMLLKVRLTIIDSQATIGTVPDMCIKCHICNTYLYGILWV